MLDYVAQVNDILYPRISKLYNRYSDFADILNFSYWSNYIRKGLLQQPAQ